MKQLLASLLIAVTAFAVQAKETIFLSSPYNAAHGGHGATMLMLQKANEAQNKYNFVLDNKPGAGSLLALRAVLAQPNNTVGIMFAGTVDLFETKQLNENDFVPIHAIGDACWAVATNLPADESRGIKSIKAPAGTNTIFIGVPGAGSVSHIVGLAAAEHANLVPTSILFKSGGEAFMNLVGNHGVNLSIFDVPSIVGMRDKNPNVKMVATLCRDRHTDAPHVPTLQEQGLGHVPPVFNIVLAPQAMPEDKRREIGSILDAATVAVGRDTIFAMSGFRSPLFNNVSAQRFYNERVSQIRNMRKKYAKEIEASSK